MRQLLCVIILCLAIGDLKAQNIADFISLEPAPQDGNFYIPSTHTFQYIIGHGDPLTEGGVLPDKCDFTGYVPINGSSTNGYLSINSELVNGGNTILDIYLDPINQRWETTASEAVDFTAFGGTSKNCSGAVTPWGTIISCEENTSNTDVNGDGYKDWGWAVEIDPVTRTVIDKRWAMGNFKHENAAVHENQRTIYQGVDATTGYLYKFVADNAADLSSGDLYVYSGSKNGSGSWVQIPNDTQYERNNTLYYSSLAGGTVFNGVEDIEIGPDGLMYMAVKNECRTYRFQDSDPLTGGSVPMFETFLGGMNYTIVTENGTVSEPWGCGNDNLAFDGEGNLWIFQDGDNNYIWVAKNGHTQANPKVELFGKTPYLSEPTGITFSPDYKYLFMSIMEPSSTNNYSSQTDEFGTVCYFDRDVTIVIALKENLGAPPCNLTGNTCDDGDVCTIGETYDTNCDCNGGVYQDSDNDGICNVMDACPNMNDALIGTACDDGDICTIGETYDANCNCSGGINQDSDNDNVCDGLDVCPNMDDALIGMPCDDGDVCTTGETYDANCGCSGGTIQDNDNDGVCSAEDSDDNDACIPNETGPECGEMSCNNLINFNDFESGLGIWNDGGSDCYLIPSYANSGVFSVRLRDNSGSFSSMYTDVLNLANYTALEISFSYITNSMDNVYEDFWLQISTNGGSSYTTVEEWNLGDEFQNNQRKNDVVSINGYNLNNNTRIRFVCDASANGDQVYIDDVLINACTGSINCIEGSACNDGDSCTTGDVYDATCNCVGTFQDSDADGVCDADDMCTNLDDALIGTPCNDGNACTVGEVYDANCNCSGGVAQDTDGDGVCDATDADPNNPCLPDPTFGNCGDGNGDGTTTCGIPIDAESFEYGWGIWNDGGSDSYRSTLYPNSGNHSIRLRDNSGIYSSMYTDNMDLSGYNSLEIDFSYYPYSMDNVYEDFLLEVSTDGGYSFTVLEEWNYTDEFTNYQRYNETVTIDNITFTQNTRIRFRCDASSNQDQVYIDDVIIKGCIINAARLDINASSLSPINFNVYPNPTQDNVQLDVSQLMDKEIDVVIFDIQGRIVFETKIEALHNPTTQLDLKDLQNGTYLMHLYTENLKITPQKIMIIGH